MEKDLKGLVAEDGGSKRGGVGLEGQPLLATGCTNRGGMF